MRSTRVWMRSNRVVRASGSQCRSRNCSGFDPSILPRHTGIWGAADEVVLNIVHKEKKSIKVPFYKIITDVKATRQAIPTMEELGGQCRIVFPGLRLESVGKQGGGGRGEWCFFFDDSALIFKIPPEIRGHFKQHGQTAGGGGGGVTIEGDKCCLLGFLNYTCVWLG